MSDSEGSSPVEEDPNAIEDREADEGFHEACSRAVVCMCERRHYDMLLDKGRSKRSASSINGHLASRMSGMPWQRVRDHVLSLLPVTLQNSLHKEIDIVGSCWDVPLAANDAHIIRRNVQGSYLTRWRGCPLRRTSCRPTSQIRVMKNGWVVAIIVRHTKHMRETTAYEFLARSVPVESRNTFIEWLAQRRATKRRRMV